MELALFLIGVAAGMVAQRTLAAWERRLEERLELRRPLPLDDPRWNAYVPTAGRRRAVLAALEPPPALVLDEGGAAKVIPMRFRVEDEPEK